MWIESLERRSHFSTTFPSGIAGYTFRCIVNDGEFPFASVGVFDFKPSKTGLTYQIDGIVGLNDSSGTYYFQKVSSTKARVIFDDSNVGPGTSLNVGLTGDNSGSFTLTDADRTGFMSGTFTMTPPAPTTGIITGTVFKDPNRSGAYDRGDSVWSNVSVWLDQNGDNVRSTNEPMTTTNAAGVYVFASLNPGTYRVTAKAPLGYVRTLPANGSATVGTYSQAVVAGRRYSGRNFGFAPSSTISGSIFRDSNSNGRRDSGEQLLSGWRVYIDGNKNGKFDRAELSTFSGSGGTWSLTVTPPGVFAVRVNTTSFVYSAAIKVGQNRTGVGFAIPFN